MAHESKTTTDHDTIKNWVEERGGYPARVALEAEGQDDAGILRIDFGEPEASLERISWEDFFAIFDDRMLVFLYQEETASGEMSRFHKFITEEAAADIEE